MSAACLTPRLAIIGGAGPMAGVSLFQQIIRLCQEKYGCCQDADFPYMLLLNYPFADMLHGTCELERRNIILDQVADCFHQLKTNGVDIAAIACNTLHAFLEPTPSDKAKLVHMILETALVLSNAGITQSLVLCTNTSATCQLHRRFFDCFYPEKALQQQVQKLIDTIMTGRQGCSEASQLAASLNAELNSPRYKEEKIGLVLGCTELSVFNEQFPLRSFGLDPRLEVLDPNQIVAEKICKLIFKKETY